MALSLRGPRGHDVILDALSSGTVWDPVPALENYPPSPQFARDMHAVTNREIDWQETPEAHVLKVDLPGLTKEQVKVKVVNGTTLEICGERKEEVQKGDTWHRVERARGTYLSHFRLPENADVDEVEAQVLDGILTVTILKLQEPEPQVRLIEIA